MVPSLVQFGRNIRKHLLSTITWQGESSSSHWSVKTFRTSRASNYVHTSWPMSGQPGNFCPLFNGYLRFCSLLTRREIRKSRAKYQHKLPSCPCTGQLELQMCTSAHTCPTGFHPLDFDTALHEHGQQEACTQIEGVVWIDTEIS